MDFRTLTFAAAIGWSDAATRARVRTSSLLTRQTGFIETANASRCIADIDDQRAFVRLWRAGAKRLIACLIAL